MKKNIYTSNYTNVRHGNKISISKDKGKDAGYEGDVLLSLAPKEQFFRIWKNNRGKISDEENNAYYIKNFYEQILKNMNPDTFIETLPNNSILLCYEENNCFCHRHLVAFWLELFLDIKTFEVKEIDNYKLEKQERPEYLKEILENIIKENYNMHGFKSIRAAYLFEGAEQLEQSIKEICKEKTLDNYEGELFTIAARLRMDADEAEEKYLKEKNKVMKYTK